MRVAVLATLYTGPVMWFSSRLAVIAFSVVPSSREMRNASTELTLLSRDTSKHQHVQNVPFAFIVSIN